MNYKPRETEPSWYQRASSASFSPDSAEGKGRKREVKNHDTDVVGRPQSNFRLLTHSLGHVPPRPLDSLHPDAQLIQRGFHAAGFYQSTILGVLALKTKAAFDDAYWAGKTPAEVGPVTPTGGTPWMPEANRWLGLREIAKS